jgi:branched-chain amino acid transport system substrate-binding protein
MKFARLAKLVLGAIAMAAPLALSEPAPANAQTNEQFVPILIYRTGPYAAGGTGIFGGLMDYMAMINARDGGINGVKLTWEECETAYQNDRGVECYERLKGKGPTGAAVVHPLSTGITYSLIERATADKIPIISLGYGRTDASDGRVFPYIFPLITNYWAQNTAKIKFIGQKEGGMEKLKGKKISLVYHDSPYGKEPIAALEARAKLNGFTFKAIPVTHPGVEQKSQWLSIRQDRPDYVLLWGWGVMNSTAIKEAAAVGYPRDKVIGVWWSGAEPDVTPAGEQSTGYKALMLQHGPGKFAVHADLEKFLVSKGKSVAKEDFAQVLYNRGLINSMIGTEAIRTAMKKYGNKPMTGEQVRWGFENLNLTAARIKELGFEGMLQPLRFSCEDHQGADVARVQQWDGKAWKTISDYYKADESILAPLVKENAAKYATEKKITARDCSKES